MHRRTFEGRHLVTVVLVTLALVSGNFEAFKLAEVVVTILAEDTKEPLSGVVVSMSGGKSYRQNSLSGADGVISFHSLLPGEYFLRCAMKEYNFQPPNKMVKVEQGDTTNIAVRWDKTVTPSRMNLRGVSIPLKKCANLALSGWICWGCIYVLLECNWLVAARDSQSLSAVQPVSQKGINCLVEQKLSHTRTPS